MKWLLASVPSSRHELGPESTRESAGSYVRWIAESKVVGRSMETAIPDGSWALCRLFPDGVAPSATALDARRVVVQLRNATDPETGGSYTIKRWRVTATDPDGGAAEIELRPDNPDFKPIGMRREDGEMRLIAEFLEVVG